MIKIEKKKFDKFFEILKKDFIVFAPKGEGIDSTYNPVETISEINFDIQNTSKTPKDIFFPQTEVLFTFKNEKIDMKKKSDKPIAIWGVRPCDAKSFTLVDKIFGKAKQKPKDENFEDPYWKSKYDDSLIFSVACNLPASTCFCNWFESGPFEKTGSDIFVVDIDEYFLLEAVSEKGRKFIDRLNDFESITNDKTIEELKNKAEKYLPEVFDVNALDKQFGKLFEDMIWDELAAKCINCGACTYACSTCHCFDVQDEGKAKSGKRIRIWDSCMFPNFTKEASGHNPRSLSKERFRQRILHKFKYFPDNYEEYLCTGCGRCIQVCPVNVDIRDVLEKLFLRIGSK